MIAGIALAGGGNRCYWQGGVLDALFADGFVRPRLLVGVSAGAFQATIAAVGIGDAVRDIVVTACRSTTRNVEWARLRQGRSPFPVGELYPQLMRQVLTPDVIARLRTAPEVLIKVARPPRGWPTGLATVAGLLAYQVEKKLTNVVHPKAGRRLGFVPHYVSTHDVESQDALVAALAASAAVPPFMPVGQVDGSPALDGGLVDNVPVDRLLPLEAAGERTLVLVTRRYAALPSVPGRLYVQPSQPVPVGRFDLTDGDGIAAAYRLGRADGAALVAALESEARRSGRSSIEGIT